MTELTTESILAPESKEGILFDVGSLMAVLHQIQDPRAPRGVRYSLVTLLMLLILVTSLWRSVVGTLLISLSA